MQSITIQNQEFRFSVEKGGALFYVKKTTNGNNELKQVFGSRLGDTGRAMIVNEKNVNRICNWIMNNSKIIDDPSLDEFLKFSRGE